MALSKLRQKEEELNEREKILAEKEQNFASKEQKLKELEQKLANGGVVSVSYPSSATPVRSDNPHMMKRVRLDVGKSEVA
jgi:chromosome condensin MukBEF ATPase and DNA-binding subunit MukB